MGSDDPSPRDVQQIRKKIRQTQTEKLKSKIKAGRIRLKGDEPNPQTRHAKQLGEKHQALRIQEKAARRGGSVSTTKARGLVREQASRGVSVSRPGPVSGFARLGKIAKGVGRVGGGAVGLLLGGITMGLEARRRAREKKKGKWI